MSRNLSQQREIKQGLADVNYNQYLKQLKSKDFRAQLESAKEFYAFLLNELKKVKRDDETNFVDNLMPTIRELVNENNANITDKVACIYIITSIINLDNINVRVRRRHQKSLFRWLRNLLASNDLNIIHMASRAMGRYAMAGVECDLEFKSSIEYLKSENRSYQAILLLRELSLAHPPRLFLNSVTFFENIMAPFCDRNPQIRYEAIELFRLSLIICVNREITAGTSQAQTNSLTQRIRRTSTTSSFGSINQENNNMVITNNFYSTGTSSTDDNNLADVITCFRNSVKNLETLIGELSNSTTRSSITSLTGGLSGSHQSTREDRIHGHLLVVLEILKFASLDYENKIEKYLSTYNVYHQPATSPSSIGPSPSQSTAVNLFDNASHASTANTTARTCEEMHALNMIKLLPHGCFDPLHSNDPFSFLFKREKIHINVESQTCRRLIAERYERIMRCLLLIIQHPGLNLSNAATISSSSQTGQSAANSFLMSVESASVSLSSSSLGRSSSSLVSSPTGLGVTSSGLLVPSAHRCILDTVLALLPRMARFNRDLFNSAYAVECLKFLSNLNNATQFLTPAASVGSGGVGASSAWSGLTPVTGNFCRGTVKSEILYCMGFMSLALENTNSEFNTNGKRFIESLKTSTLLKAGTGRSGPTASGGSRRLTTNQEIQQTNELNSVMGFVAMFSSVGGSSAGRLTIAESVKCILEPLMSCSGGVTLTMRHFLNEMSLHVPELRQPINDNLLKILADVLTGCKLTQIIQSISTSAQHLTHANNLYSLMTNSSRAGNAAVAQTTPSASPALLPSQPGLNSELIPPQMDPESIVNSLQTLRTFEFSSLYVIAFLRYCVDYYLHHESRLVKIEAVLTTSHLLSRLIVTLNEQDSRSLISIVSCALRKLLICAITDFEPDVRYHVLNSLDNDNRFNMFVSLPENLNILFMCVRDERPELRELSASMISRLSGSNSAYILPFIRKILMQLLTEVDIYPDIGQREKSVRLIGYLLSHAPRLVNLYIKPLLDCLNAKLAEYRQDISFASSIVTVVGQLASQSNAETILHFDTVIPFLIESMQDFYYVQLKHTSLWALSQIVANTGYVIAPYKKYPNLLEILLGFLQSETSVQIRRETIRVLGLIGAIDPFEYKRTLLKSKRDELLNAAINAAQQQQQQLATQLAANAAKPLPPAENGADGALANNPPATTNADSIIYLQPGVTAAAQAAAVAANLNANNNNNGNGNNDQANLDPIEMLISMNANNSLDEYYPALAIHLIMKTIKNSVSIEVRRDAIGALVLAMRTLDNRCVNYVELVIPPFLDLIKTMNDNLVIDLIVNLGFLVGYIKKHIEPYLNRILNIIEFYWNKPDIPVKMIVALIELVQSIANVMDIEFKRYLPKILPLLLKQLQLEIKDGSLTNSQKLLSLLRSCSCCLENYIHLILSEFAEYLTCRELNESNATSVTNVKQEIMFTIYTFARQLNLSDNCAILFQSFIKILEQNINNVPMPSNQVLSNNPLLTQQVNQPEAGSGSGQVAKGEQQQQSQNRLGLFQNSPPILSITYLLFSNSNAGTTNLTQERLSHSTDLSTLTIETLYLLARQMGGRFFVFAPMFDRLLVRNANYHRLYQQLMVNCREASFHTFWSNQNFITGSGSVNQISTLHQSNNPSTSGATPEIHTPFRQNQQVSFGNLKVCIDRADQLPSREGWRESFRTLTLTVVQETPINTLRACSLIPYETIPADLFNACFISIWVKINEKEQNDLIKYIELALRNSYLPETIKMILNLAEFIERCDVGHFLPLDYNLLAEKAIQVKAYAKALHYVEEQFHAVMAASSLTNNLSDMFTGVGGVSGAGGGSGFGGANCTVNITSRIMFTNMSTMKPQQLQQTLIYLLEQLVTLNHELQKTEAAMGVLDFAGKYLKSLDSQTKVKERWHEKLHQWQKALNIYEKELNAQQPVLGHFLQNDTSTFIIVDGEELNEPKLDLLMGRMRCLKGLGEWKRLVFSCNDLFKQVEAVQSSPTIGTGASLARMLSANVTSQSSSNMENIVHIVQQSTLNVNESHMSYLRQLNQQQTQHLKEKISEMGAAACWGLGEWDQMRTFVTHLPESSYNGLLYRSVLALSADLTGLADAECDLKQQAISSLIEQTRDLLDADLTSMASQSYDRSYQAIIEAQVLAELEEILTYKRQPAKRDWLTDTWWKRLQGCERSLEYWQRLLAVRSTVLDKHDDIKHWLKFCTMCQKAGQLGLANQILTSLLQSDEIVQPVGLNSMTKTRNYELCKYAYYKFMFANGDRDKALDGLTTFTNNLAAQFNQYRQYQASQQMQQQQQINIGFQNPQQTQQQLPASFSMLNPRDVQKRRAELENLLGKCYLKLGQWTHDLDSFTPATIETIIGYYRQSKENSQQSYKSWQAWAYGNYEAIHFYKTNAGGPATAPGVDVNQLRVNYVKQAISGFFRCIKLSSVDQEANCLQDTLRLLTLLFEHCNSSDVFDTLNEGIKQTPVEIWLQVIPQLIARIDTNKQFVARLIHSLLTELGRVHPQALVYRLILASKTTSALGGANSHHYGVANGAGANNQINTSVRSQTSLRILNALREHNSMLVEQAKLVSEELIRVAILWHEMWHENLEEASKLHFGEKNTQGMLDMLEALHNMMNNPVTNKELAFVHAYGRDLHEARECCRRYRRTRQNQDIDGAWEKYYSVFKRITKQLPQMTTLELSYVSPRLMISRDLELAVPGTYEPNKPLIRIKAFNANIQVICSKQRPRKISIFGSNGCEYVFLLKGHEDLRQDERVMQIFGLVNNLLLKNNETARRDLAIQRYSVIPLSQNSGLLEWLLNCDTLHSLIREYREKKRLLLNLEHKIITKLAPDYDHLTPVHKVQIFEMAIESTSGNDLAEILWHKSLTAEKWLERRTNYTRSLAVMSMVGYVLGLGDRHPSNLMLDRTNGKIIHVDFGDCFETAMTREKFPEKIPFRLTRMLKNAMEVTGIEGTFRRTCESVMRVLRHNRDSVMAVLEAFVYDPLVYWRLVESTNANNPPAAINQNMPPNTNRTNNEEIEETNRKAIMVLNRVRDKLTGRDFGDEQPIDELNQVDLLIKQATSSENLCQCFIGWCAWW